MDLSYIDPILTDKVIERINKYLMGFGIKEPEPFLFELAVLDSVEKFLDFTNQESMPEDSISCLCHIVLEEYAAKIKVKKANEDGDLNSKIESLLAGGSISIGDTSSTMPKALKRDKDGFLVGEDDEEKSLLDKSWKVRAIKWRKMRK